MSHVALNHVLAIPLTRSTTKCLLIVLANAADDTGLSFCSQASLMQGTCQNRKTLIDGLKRLISLRHLENTGDQRGETQRVIVYQILGIPNAASVHYTFRVLDPRTGDYCIASRSFYGDPEADARYLGDDYWPQQMIAHRQRFALIREIIGCHATLEAALAEKAALLHSVAGDPACRNDPPQIRLPAGHGSTASYERAWRATRAGCRLMLPTGERVPKTDTAKSPENGHAAGQRVPKTDTVKSPENGHITQENTPKPGKESRKGDSLRVPKTGLRTNKKEGKGVHTNSFVVVATESSPQTSIFDPPTATTTKPEVVQSDPAQDTPRQDPSQPQPLSPPPVSTHHLPPPDASPDTDSHLPEMLAARRMIAIWNETVAKTELHRERGTPEPSFANALAAILEDAPFRGDLTRWRRFCHFAAADPFMRGERAQPGHEAWRGSLRVAVKPTVRARLIADANARVAEAAKYTILVPPERLFDEHGNGNMPTLKRVTREEWEANQRLGEIATAEREAMASDPALRALVRSTDERYRQPQPSPTHTPTHNGPKRRAGKDWVH